MLAGLLGCIASLPLTKNHSISDLVKYVNGKIQGLTVTFFSLSADNYWCYSYLPFPSRTQQRRLINEEANVLL